MAIYVNRPYLRYNAPDLLNFSTTAHNQALTNTETFAHPMPSNAAFHGILGGFITAKDDAAGGDKFKKAILRDKMALMVAALDERANYIGGVAKNDPHIVILGGFTYRKPYANRYIHQMDTPTAKIGVTRGTVDVATPGQIGMKNCTWYITTDPGKPLSEWTSYPNMGARFTFSGLLTGETYYICVDACGPRNQCFTSPMASIVAY